MDERRRLASAMAGLSVVVALSGCAAPPAADPAAAPGAARDVDDASPDRGVLPDRGPDERVAHAAALERAARDCRSAVVSLEGTVRLPEPSPPDLRRADQRLSVCTSSLAAVQTRMRRAGHAEDPDVRRAAIEVRQVLGTATRLDEELTRIADTQPRLAVLVRELDRGVGALRPRSAPPRPDGRG